MSHPYYHELYGKPVVVSYGHGEIKFIGRYLNHETEDDLDDQPVAYWYELQPLEPKIEHMVNDFPVNSTSLELYDEKTMEYIPFDSSKHSEEDVKKAKELEKYGYVLIEGVRNKA